MENGHPKLSQEKNNFRNFFYYKNINNQYKENLLHQKIK